MKIIPITKAYRENWERIFAKDTMTFDETTTPTLSSGKGVISSSASANYGGKAMPFQYPAYLIVNGEVHW